MEKSKPQHHLIHQSKPISKRIKALIRLLENRIVYLDGAMGTMIQAHKLEENDFRGTRFANHPVDLKGNNDLLTITRPDIIKTIHKSFF